MRTKTITALFMILVCLSTAFAEDQLGVAVYPGAEYDPARTNKLRVSLGVKGAAYRTSDAMDKVTAFYRKQKLLFLKIGASDKVARFRKVETDVEVVVQKLVNKGQTGAAKSETLIMIYKKDEKGSKPDVAI